MTTVPSATTWGSPNATKHALLIHGLTSSSHTWNRVATSLAAKGYFVTAPNLIGHGGRVSDDYHHDNISQDLRPYLEARKYELIMGHSLGGVVALHLLPYLSRNQPIAIVLVDPPLSVLPDQVAFWKTLFTTECADKKTGEMYEAEHPLWTREDGICRALAIQLCAPGIARDILTRNTPWHFLDRLNDVVMDKWKVSVVLADPKILELCTVKQLEPYPHVRHVFAPGAGHWIQSEYPDVIVEEALKRVAELDAS